MIAKMTGQLAELDAQTNAVLLSVGDITYELMVPGYAISDLSAQLGRSVTLYCLEYYEASGMGGNLTPRIIGFPHKTDKLFFQKFTSVKGIGARKALRALARRPEDIAQNIEDGDAAMLATLPEVGKRTAEQIIAELKGKLKTFAAASAAGPTRKPLSSIERETLEVLLQLGEKRPEAEEFITAVLRQCPEIKTTDALVQAVYRLKAGAL